MDWRGKLDGDFSFFISLYSIAKTAVTGRPKRGESQKAAEKRPIVWRLHAVVLEGLVVRFFV